MNFAFLGHNPYVLIGGDTPRVGRLEPLDNSFVPGATLDLEQVARRFVRCNGSDGWICFRPVEILS